MKIRSLIVFLAVYSTLELTAQTVAVPTGHEAYDFLRRMESKQLIHDYRDAARPLSRMDIARHLSVLEKCAEKLTWVERERFEFLKTEFSYEMGSLAGDRNPSDIRWHIASFPFEGGILNLDPNLDLSYTKYGSKDVSLRRWGLRSYGYIDKHFGFLFNFQHSREIGPGVDALKLHSPETGIVIARALQSDIIEYNNTDVQLGATFGSFDLSLEKLQNVWGAGERGTLIFSRKAPSYPQIKLRVRLTDWMDFVYFHAELHSNVIDSAASYHAGSSSVIDFYRTVYRQKYLAAHQIEFTPINGLDISLGESVVYSDRGPLLMYLMPIMFFKSAEHYNRDTDNTQMFGTADVTLLRGVNLYLSVFVDEIVLETLFKSAEEGGRQQAGYTAGLHTYDLGVDNVELIAEYSRLNPWMYTHKFPAVTFTNNGYQLGHWIGQNADNLYFEARYLPTRWLTISGFWERYRKGGEEDVSRQYQSPQPSFLYAPLRLERSAGGKVRLQFAREAFVDLWGRVVSISDDRAPIWNVSKQVEYSLSLRYGLW
jgi:hypothetical protein